jgi:hypothetical protein
LVGSRIWHRQTSAIDNFDPPAQPELLVGDLPFELLGHLGADLLEHCLIDARGGEKIRQIRRFEDRIKSGPFLLRERINF